MSALERCLVKAGAATALGCSLSGCILRVRDPIGPVGMQERAILLDALVIMLCIIVPSMVATLAFVW